MYTLQTCNQLRHGKTSHLRGVYAMQSTRSIIAPQKVTTLITIFFQSFFFTHQTYKMECLFGITGNGFSLLAADTISARSIVVMKGTEDKSRELNTHTVMLYTGEPGDTVNFAEYIQRNIKLYGIRNGLELSPKATATFTRRELADSLRSRVNFVGFHRKTAYLSY